MIVLLVFLVSFTHALIGMDAPTAATPAAARQSQAETIQRLLADPKTNPNCLIQNGYYEGWTLLQMAAYLGCWDIVLILLADDRVEPNHPLQADHRLRGWTPLELVRMREEHLEYVIGETERRVDLNCTRTESELVNLLKAYQQVGECRRTRKVLKTNSKVIDRKGIAQCIRTPTDPSRELRPQPTDPRAVIVAALLSRQ